MTKTIAILNEKGGVGKTTISAHLAIALQRSGFKVRLVDSDGQGSLRDWRGASLDGDGEVLRDIHGKEYSLPVVGLDRETLAQDIKEEVKSGQHDFILIDGRAKAERMAGASIRVADLVIIPISPSALDVWATSDLIEIINTRHEVTNGNPITYFLINNAREGTKLKKEVLPVVEEYEMHIFNTQIHNREVYKQTMGEGGTVYISKNQVAIDEIESLKNEILGVLNNDEK